MVRGNRRFNWRRTRDEEIQFGFAAGDDGIDDDEPETRVVEHLGRNDSYNARLLVNDNLYVAPNEHTGITLTTDLFDGKNFHSWSRAVKRALFAKNKLGFLDGTIPKPEEDSEDYFSWVRADYLIFTWLSNSVVKELSRGFQNLKTSKDLWDELNKRFGKKNGPRLYKLRREIASYTQKNQSILAYFNNLSSLWDDLELLRTGRVCVCEASRDIKQETEEMHMMQFLMGLNDAYEPIRQQILILVPLPTVNQAYSMVLEVEEQVEISAHYSEGAEHNAMYSQQKGKNNGEGFKRRLTKEEKMRLKCDHCGKSGHLKAYCFEINGVPDWYKKIKPDKGKGRAYFVDDQIQTSQQSHDGGQNEEEIGRNADAFKKIIQEEIAKHFATLVKKDGSGIPKLMNMAEVDYGENSVEYKGHYAFAISSEINRDEWIVDSGASSVAI